MLDIDVSHLFAQPGSIVEHIAYETTVEAWHEKSMAIVAMAQGRWRDAARHAMAVVAARAKLAHLSAMRDNPDKVKWMCVACGWAGEGYELYRRQAVSCCPSCGRSGGLTASLDAETKKPPQRPKK